MIEPRIVSPEEAAAALADRDARWRLAYDLTYTVATEPDRTRAAVILELDRLHDEMGALDPEEHLVHLWERLHALQNGADL